MQHSIPNNNHCYDDDCGPPEPGHDLAARRLELQQLLENASRLPHADFGRTSTPPPIMACVLDAVAATAAPAHVCAQCAVCIIHGAVATIYNKVLLILLFALLSTLLRYDDRRLSLDLPGR